MTIYDVMESVLSVNVLAYAAVIAAVLITGTCIGIVACALDTEHDEVAREVSRLGRRALAELEAAHADVLRLGQKIRGV